MAPTERKPRVQIAVTASILVNLALGVCVATIGFFLQAEFAESRETRKEFGNEIQQIQLAITRMEGNRFTSEDGAEVWKDMAALQTQVSTMIAALPPEYPPEWFAEHVARIGEDASTNRQDIKDLTVQVMQLTAVVEVLHNDRSLPAHVDDGG